jgi:hypothetical protein
LILLHKNVTSVMSSATLTPIVVLASRSIVQPIHQSSIRN